MSQPNALAFAPAGCRPEDIGALPTQPQSVPVRRLPLRPGQLRCLQEIASACGDRPFTRLDVGTLSGGAHLRSEDSVLRQLVQQQFVTIVTRGRPRWTYRLSLTGVDLAESLREEHALCEVPAPPDTVLDACAEQFLVALDGVLSDGRGTVESAACLTRRGFTRGISRRVRRYLIELGMLRESGWLEITLRGRSYLDLLASRDPDDVWTLEKNGDPSPRARRRLNFLPFPPRLRGVVKEYIRIEMKRRRAPDYGLDRIFPLTEFIRTYAARHPNAEDLTELTVDDIDAFVRQSCTRSDGDLRPTQSVYMKLSAIRTFLTFAAEQEPTLLPATFQPRWLSGRVTDRHGRPALKSDAPAHLSLVESPEEAELRAQAYFQRDAWDIDVLPGVPRKDHWTQKTLSFVGVPELYRSAAKAYAKHMLAARGKSLSSLTGNIRHIARFFEFWVQRYPDRTSLADLAFQDLSDFVATVRAGNTRPNHVHDRYYAVRRFVVWLQRIEDPLAPTRQADRLFDPSIAPKEPHHALTGQKWIPESVIRQLDANIQHLGPVYMPVVSILRASGWRVSDVVSLCYDTCVQQEGDKWWLVGDIQKTRVLGHRIPITEEVALALRAQAEVVKASLTEAENPRHYLFPSVSSRRRGRPIASPNVMRALKQFAEKHAILGEDGKPFRLKTHAFRHSKAVELINNGMPLDYVRRWLAHLSPEMTVVYAKIRDDVLRERWEQATAEGVLRLDVDQIPQLISADTLAAGDELELERIRGNLDATRTEKGYCFKPKRMPCSWAEIACYTCTHYATTPKFLSEFEEMERDLLFQIELGRESGRAHWIEKNERKLALIQPIIETLRGGRTVAHVSKSQRETIAQYQLGRALPGTEPV